MASADGKLDAFLACEADPVREDTVGAFIGGFSAAVMGAV